MIGPDVIDGLPSCEPGCEDGGIPCEMKTALRYLSESSERYGMETEPLAPITKPDRPKRFVAMSVRMSGSPARIIRMDVASESTEYTSGRASTSGLGAWLSDHILTRKLSGHLIVTSGQERHILDVFVEQFGEYLCGLGYVLSPRISGSHIGFLHIAKRGGKDSWVLAYAETVSGVTVSSLVGYARSVSDEFASGRYVGARMLYGAIDAYQSLLLTSFGIALCPTVGMIASRCVRSCLPRDFRKWRPDPLLVAMERTGDGYRGGITFGVRYRGPSVRVDVVRQYTHALASPLPYRAAFGRYISEVDTPHGVFLCRVRFRHPVAYPLGIWDSSARCFRYVAVAGGTVVCILHTAEFPGLRAHGAEISPYYGFVFTRVFSLGRYRERLQALLDSQGYGSDLSKIVKPLGNYVYGKFGQNPVQKTLAYSSTRPRGYHPYIDEGFESWPMVWEKETKRYTSMQHVEIAGTITAHARNQTMLMWALCSTFGVTVVRCHTDSLTLAGESLPLDLGANGGVERIGGWRVECSADDSIIVAANAYADGEKAHVGGVTDPTWEIVERLYDGAAVYITQTETSPLRGFVRGMRSVRKRLG